MALKDLGIHEVMVYYSGSGDSGSIEDLTCYDNEGNEIDITSELDENIKDIADIYLSDIEDWWNDNGGYGNMRINVTDGTYNIENNIYITEEFLHEGKIDLD